MDKMVLGAFRDRDSADSAVAELQELGYEPTEISVIASGNKDEAQRMGEDTAEGAAAGATTGAAVGGIAGLLAGAGVFPALAGLFIGGPIAVALGLTGIAATTVSGAITGALAGGLIGALTGMGVSEEVAARYEDIVNEGGVILGVPARNGDEARDVLDSYGAVDVTEVNVKERTRAI